MPKAPEEVRRARKTVRWVRHARKMIQWIIFSAERAGRHWVVFTDERAGRPWNGWDGVSNARKTGSIIKVGVTQKKEDK